MTYTVDNYADILRSDLNQIYQWILDWVMLYTVDKCSVLHLSYNNKECDYKLGCDVIRSRSGSSVR